MRKLFRLLLSIALLALWAAPAHAHFLTDAQSREIHVFQDKGLTQVVMRLPATFVYARELAARTDHTSPIAMPFLMTEMIGTSPFYRFDGAAVQAQSEKFADLVFRDISFSQGGVVQTPSLFGLKALQFEPAATLPSGLDALRDIVDQAEPIDSAYVSDVIVFVRFVLPAALPDEELKLDISGPPFALPDTIHVATRVVDHRTAQGSIYDVEGFWSGTIVLSPNPLFGFIQFVGQGMEHILFGLDHVLFVLCLVLAATRLKWLIWSATGFTLGHSVTLAAGVLGLVPDVLWFIPTVELGVALSIVAMAVLVVWSRHASMRFWIAASLGLLHGFGFAAMLSPMLDGAANLVSPLLAFNLGVEIGQLLLVMPAFAAASALSQLYPRFERMCRLSAAGGAGGLALLMSVERVALLVPLLPGGGPA